LSVSYDRFIERITNKGISLHSLKKRGIITQYAYERMSKNEPVSLDVIANLCRHFGIPIEEVVEIKLEGESDQSL